MPVVENVIGGMLDTESLGVVNEGIAVRFSLVKTDLKWLFRASAFPWESQMDLPFTIRAGISRLSWRFARTYFQN